jgi:hypothetical protein
MPYASFRIQRRMADGPRRRKRSRFRVGLLGAVPEMKLGMRRWPDDWRPAPP